MEGTVFIEKILTFSLHCCPLNSLQKRKAESLVYVTLILHMFFVSEMSCLNQRLVIKVGVLTDKKGTCLLLVTKDLVLELLHAFQSSCFPFAALRSPKVVSVHLLSQRDNSVIHASISCIKLHDMTYYSRAVRKLDSAVLYDFV